MINGEILILDFGSQYTQLIARRCREMGVFSEILRFDTSVAEIAARRPAGIVRSGGSIPAPSVLQAAGIPVALMGFALPDSRLHGPNATFDLPTFFRAIVASARRTRCWPPAMRCRKAMTIFSSYSAIPR